MIAYKPIGLYPGIHPLAYTQVYTHWLTPSYTPIDLYPGIHPLAYICFVAVKKTIISGYATTTHHHCHYHRHCLRHYHYHYHYN